MSSSSPLAIPDSVDQANRSFLDSRHQLAAEIVTSRSGLDTAEQLTELADRWLNELWSLTLPQNLQKSVSLYATGGYGRRELAYHSDIDVLVALHDDELAEDDEFALAMERLMAWSRQPRIKLSHAVRTPDQARHAVRDDLRNAIALLDLRHLSGPRASGDHFQRQTLVDHLRGSDDGRGFTQHLIEGLRRRIARHGRTVFLLEPDVKDGEGGLRDLNSLRWAARVRWNLDIRRHTGPALGWTDARRRAYVQSLDELLALRNQLHLLHDRKHDRLSFRDQEALTTLSRAPSPKDPDHALALARRALSDANAAAHAQSRSELQPAIETLMTNYYRRARSIATTCERCLRQWATVEDSATRRIPPFEIAEGQLAIAADASLDDGDIFDALQLANGEDLLLHPRLEATIEYQVDSWPIGDDLDSERAIQCRDLLIDLHASPRTSQRLLELGILPCVVPEFEPLICHVHHDLYHVYTTDIHSLKCLEAARRLLNTDPDAHPRPPFATIAHSIEDTTTFLLAALFHDIGKNRGGQHSRRGAEIMMDVGPRLGMDAERTHRLSTLVRHHLLLSNTSRRRDISDPDILQELVHKVGDLEFLNQLTALTYCDMSTVGPDVMDDWNASLLLQLHHRLHKALQSRDRTVAANDEDDQTTQRNAHRKRLQAALSDADDHSHLKSFVDALPLEHLASTDDDALLRQYTTYCRALDKRTGFAISSQPLADRSVTELIITGPDAPGTLANIAGAIASVGINIMAADIVSTIDGFAVDIFHIAHFNPRAVPPTNPRPVEAPRRLKRLQERISDVLGGDVDVDELLEKRRTEQRLAPRPVPAVSTEVRIAPDASRRFTVIEVRAPDQLGLLYTIAKTLFDCHVDTRVSRIDSLGHQAIDTFYVEEFDGQPLSEPRITEVTDALRQALANFLS